MKGPSKEYLFLFNLLTTAEGDMEELQHWCENIRTQAVNRFMEANAASAIQGVALMEQALVTLQRRFFDFRVMFEDAQRQAEEIFLTEGD